MVPAQEWVLTFYALPKEVMIGEFAGHGVMIGEFPDHKAMMIGEVADREVMNVDSLVKEVMIVEGVIYKVLGMGLREVVTAKCVGLGRTIPAMSLL